MKAVTTNCGTLVPEIYISVNKNRQKIYKVDRSLKSSTQSMSGIYMNDKSNFEIELYNNQNENVGFEIYINGKLISTSLLILKPGQRYFLDRFIDTNNKFVFETYSVKDNQTNRNAIENNGLVTIKCYKEHFITNYYPYQQPYIVSTPYYYYYYSTGIGTTLSSSSFMHSSNANTTTQLNTNNATLTCNTTSGTYNMNQQFELETGRVEKGDMSNQHFDYTNFTRSILPFHTVDYILLPSTVQAKNLDEIKHYCPKCGYRIRKKSHNFCPNCGDKI